MKRKGLLLLTLSPLFLLSMVGCFKQEVPSFHSSTIDESDITTTGGDVNPIPNQTYDTFWDPQTYVQLDIRMSQEAAEFINNYQSSTDSTYHDYYVPCTVIVRLDANVYTFEEVGIRQKGNLSRTQMLINGNFSLDSLAHYKLNFKQTFDDEEYSTIQALKPFKKTWEDSSKRKERKNRRLFDMEKIDIKWNRNDDQTRVRQSYALKTFRENGVLAGHSTLGLISMGINNKTPVNATYEIFECIDESFIQKNFEAEEAEGDLYKCTYSGTGPANFSDSYTVGNQIGVENNVTNYHPSYDLKTNKKKNTTHTNLLNLRTAINDKTSSASEYITNIEQYIDMEEFMKYESIAYLMGNFDDMRNNANNYYIYITKTTKKAYFIPYDFDRCLGCGCLGKQDYMTNFSPESTKMQCNGDWQSINLFWRTVCSSSDSASGHQNVERVEKYRAMYQKNIEDLLNNGTISSQSFTSYVNSFSTEYRGNPNGSGDGNTTFSNYLSKKIQAIKRSNNDGLINYDIKV